MTHRTTSFWTLAVAALFILIVPGTLLATETEPAFIISEVRYQMDGRTRQWIAEDKIDLREGLTFASQEELDAFLARQTQLLVNERALQEAEIAVDYRPAEDGEPQGVVVTVITEDTWNFFVLPYFKYDSNTGLLLSLRGRDFNFFGTLTELAVDLDYERTEDEENLYTIATKFDVPFQMFDRRWRLLWDQSIEFEADELDVDTSLGLGYNFDMLGLGWEAIYRQSYRYDTDDDEGDTDWYTSRLSLGTAIDTPVFLPGFGVVTYNPELYTETNYRPGGISEEREGIITGYDQALEAGSYDWIGNYRNGQTIELSNDNGYNITNDDWDIELEGRINVFRSLWQRGPQGWPRAGVSASLNSFYLPTGADEDQDDAAEEARGILNDEMNGDLGVFLNLDAVLTVWTLEPIFEAQVGAFFDTAFVRDTRGDFYPSSDFDQERDLRFGSGIEVVGFPLFARSLYIRGSLGFDLRKIAQGDSPLSGDVREIFIGLGHHY